MYHILPETKGKLVAIRVEGRIGAEDYKTLLPYLEKAIQKHGSICIVEDLQDFQGVDFFAWVKIVPYAFKHKLPIEKTALITDRQRLLTVTGVLSSLFRQSNVKSFSHSDAKKAWEWIKK